MEECELLIRELRIEDEFLLSSDYNPLKQVYENKKSAIKYRNIYHRVERIMESIINTNYKGFSDSVLSYMEVCNLNTLNLILTKSLIKKLENIQIMKIDISNIKYLYKEIIQSKQKLSLIEDLRYLHNLIQEYDKEKDYKVKCNLIFNIKELINKNKLYLISGIEILRNEFLSEIEIYKNNLFNKILEYIFDDKIENKEFLIIVKKMDIWSDMDKYLYNQFDRKLLLKYPYTLPWDNINIGDDIAVDQYDSSININKIDHCINSINEYFKRKLRITFKIEKYFKNNIRYKDSNINNSNNICYITDIDLILILENDKYKKVDYSTDTLYFYKFIQDKQFSINLFYRKIKEEYNENINFYLINTIQKLNQKYHSDLFNNLVIEYIEILYSDIEKEALYLFDMFCREKVYKNIYYINKILKLIESNIKFIEFSNTFSKRNLVTNIINKINLYLQDVNIVDDMFKDMMEFLDEILGDYTNEICINYCK